MRRDRYINEVVNRVMARLLSESVSNVELSELQDWMDVYNETFNPDEEFTYEETDDNGWMFKFKYNGKAETILAHFPHTGKKFLDKGTLAQIKKALNALGWFKIPEHFFYFPWQTPREHRWGLKPGGIKPDPELLRQYKEKNGEKSPEQLEIEAANEEYKDASITRAFPSDEENEICLMWIIDEDADSITSGDTIYNLCRNDNDRRPMHNMWFDRYFTNESGDLTYLSHPRIENGDYRFDRYPVNRDGSLNKTDKITENRRHYGRKIKTLYHARF